MTPKAGASSWIPGLEDPLEKEMATHSSILTWDCSIHLTPLSHWKVSWIEHPPAINDNVYDMHLTRVNYIVIAKIKTQESSYEKSTFIEENSV